MTQERSKRALFCSVRRRGGKLAAMVSHGCSSASARSGGRFRLASGGPPTRGDAGQPDLTGPEARKVLGPEPAGWTPSQGGRVINEARR